MKKLIFLVIPFLFILFSVSGAEAFSVNTPVISDFNSGLKSFSEPFISGFTDRNTNVLVYIDGTYYGDAEIVKNGNVDSFYFYLNSILSEGEHSFFLIARDMNGVMSPQSIEKDYIFSQRLDTPRVLKTNFESSVYISGETSNENYLDFYIDSKLHKTLFVERNSKNTFEFDSTNLNKGSHDIYIIARDKIGRQSKATQRIDFFFNKTTNNQKLDSINEIDNSLPREAVYSSKSDSTKNPIISDEGVIEDVIVEGIDNIDNQEKEDEETLQDSQSKIDEILINLNEEEGENIGSLNESGEKQSDLKMNLVIFFSFLVAVILWIIWVNREVSNEETENNKE